MEHLHQCTRCACLYDEITRHENLFHDGICNQCSNFVQKHRIEGSMKRGMQINWKRFTHKYFWLIRWTTTCTITKLVYPGIAHIANDIQIMINIPRFFSEHLPMVIDLGGSLSHPGTQPGTWTMEYHKDWVCLAQLFLRDCQHKGSGSSVSSFVREVGHLNQIFGANFQILACPSGWAINGSTRW